MGKPMSKKISIKKIISFLMCVILGTTAIGCGQTKERLKVQSKPDVLTFSHEKDNTNQYQGKTYYVSNDGNDSNDGLSPAKPFKTISKINRTRLAPGDAVLFRSNDVFDDACLEIKTSGTREKNITISYYGTGNYPVIVGGTTYDTQFVLSGNLSATVGLKISSAYHVTVDGVMFEGAMFGIFLNNTQDSDFSDSSLTINDTIFRNLGGYRCLLLGEPAPSKPPFYSNAVMIGLRGQTPLSNITITNCKFYDCEAGLHIDTVTKAVLDNIYMDNIYREGILFESAHAKESDPSTITNVTIRNVGVVYGMSWGTASLQFNVCSNFICENLDISYTGNAEYKNDMVGGDFEATNKNMVVKNSVIHNNGGAAWLVYKTAGWGKDNQNCSFINNIIANNGRMDNYSVGVFLRHFYNTEIGGQIKDNKIYLAYENQYLNYIDPVLTNDWPVSYEVSGNQIMGLYQPEEIQKPQNTIYSYEFDNAFDYEQWYGLTNVAYSYPNGLYLTTKLSSDKTSDPVIVTQKDLNLNLKDVKKIQIKLKNKTKATSMKMYFADKNNNFTEEKSITIPITAMDNVFTEYTIDLENVLSLDTVGRIKIVPAENTTEGWLQYDYIRFLG